MMTRKRVETKSIRVKKKVKDDGTERNRKEQKKDETRE